MIDITKTYKTRDGREVRIYAVDGYGHWPVHGAVKTAGQWSACQWTAAGKNSLGNFDADMDLIEVRPRIQREVWVNVYPDGVSGHSSLVAADNLAINTRIACVRLTIDCEEGEGL